MEQQQILSYLLSGKGEKEMYWDQSDITWCSRECDCENCFRNPVNMVNRVGIHNWADFSATGECPLETENKILNKSVDNAENI